MSTGSPISIDRCTARPIRVARALATAPGPTGPVPRIAAANATAWFATPEAVTSSTSTPSRSTIPSLDPSRTRPAGRQQVDQQRALRAEDLAAHVIAVATVARQIDGDDRASIEFKHRDQVVDVSDVGERRVDNGRGVGPHSNHAATAEPFGQVVLVNSTVDRQAAADSWIAK